MACSFRPSRCRSKASPRMACERGSYQAQRLQAQRVPMTFLKSLRPQRLFHAVVPWTHENRGSRQDSPHFTDGETETQGTAQRGAGQDLRTQAYSWVSWPYSGYGTLAVPLHPGGSVCSSIKWGWSLKFPLQGVTETEMDLCVARGQSLAHKVLRGGWEPRPHPLDCRSSCQRAGRALLARPCKPSASWAPGPSRREHDAKIRGLTRDQQSHWPQPRFLQL